MSQVLKSLDLLTIIELFMSRLPFNYTHILFLNSLSHLACFQTVCNFHYRWEEWRHNLTTAEIILIAVWTCFPSVIFFTHLGVSLSPVLGKVRELFQIRLFSEIVSEASSVHTDQVAVRDTFE